MTRWLVAIGLLGGCDRILQLDEVPQPPPCSMPMVHDDFEASTPVCGTWATPYDSSPWMLRQNGKLVFTPPPALDTYAGCYGSFPFPFDSPVFVHVAKMGMDEVFASLEVMTYSDATVTNAETDTSLSFAGEAIDFYDQDTCTPQPCDDIAGSQYIPALMQWFQLAPSADRTSIIAQYSPDGLHWTTLGQRDLPPPFKATLVRVVIGGGGGAGGMNPVPVELESLDLCPGGGAGI